MASVKKASAVQKASGSTTTPSPTTKKTVEKRKASDQLQRTPPATASAPEPAPTSPTSPAIDPTASATATAPPSTSTPTSQKRPQRKNAPEIHAFIRDTGHHTPLTDDQIFDLLIFKPRETRRLYTRHFDYRGRLRAHNRNVAFQTDPTTGSLLLTPTQLVSALDDWQKKYNHFRERNVYNSNGELRQRRMKNVPDERSDAGRFGKRGEGSETPMVKDEGEEVKQEEEDQEVGSEMEVEVEPEQEAQGEDAPSTKMSIEARLTAQENEIRLLKEELSKIKAKQARRKLKRKKRKEKELKN